MLEGFFPLSPSLSVTGDRKKIKRETNYYIIKKQKSYTQLISTQTKRTKTTTTVY